MGWLCAGIAADEGAAWQCGQSPLPPPPLRPSLTAAPAHSYDQNDVTAGLLLEEAAEGGDFELRDGLRPSSTEHNDPSREEASQAAEVAVQQRSDPEIRTFRRRAGTLTIFHGETGYHQVTPVARGRRLSAVWCFDHQPDRMAADEINLQIYGKRIRPLLRPQPRL